MANIFFSFSKSFSFNKGEGTLQVLMKSPGWQV